MVTYTIKTYPYRKLVSVYAQRRRKGQTEVNYKKERYADMLCTFDIETTRLPDIDQSIMYIWQFAIKLPDEDEADVIIGRTWDELSYFLLELDSRIDRQLTILIFVHNLSYEFSFLRAIYDFDKKEVFAVESRKVLRCTMYKNRFEYRCSYLLTNMSLDECTKKYKVKHGKLSGADFDYNKLRYSWTPLTDDEIAYCINDVLGLIEVLQVILESDNDNFYSLPFTSTGYVRRDVKRNTRAYRKLMKEMSPDWDLYKALRAAFRGGNTHANRYYVDRCIPNVSSYDRSSSYPDVLCNCQFPSDYFTHIGAINHDYFHSLCFDRGKAMLIRVVFTKIYLRDSTWGCPYIPIAKCINRRGVVNDNGRVLLAEMIEMWITDIDFKIIRDEYDFDFIVVDCYFTKYGKIPKPYIKTIEDYYTAKTELKGVEGQEVYYMKSKNKLNSIYGMMATDPVRDTVIFNGLDFSHDEEQDKLADLEKSNRKAFVCYAWGVWCTAWARYELERGIKATGDGFIYCDTDSVKFVGEADFEPINKIMVERSKENGAYATDPAGHVHYMGVYELDDHYQYFKTMGAKKYADIDDKGKLHITIAGVNKHIGVDELLKYVDGDPLRALKECFVDGFTFSDAGGLEAKYNDDPQMSLDIDGHTVEITPNTCLIPSTYTLGKTGEYMRILQMSKTDFERMCCQLEIIS